MTDPDSAAPPGSGYTLLLGVNPDTLRISMANAAAASTLGYAPEQLQGLLITDIESALQSVFYWEEVTSGHGQAVLQQDDLYRCADGRLLAVTKSVQLLAQGGQTVYLVQASVGQGRQQVQQCEAGQAAKSAGISRAHHNSRRIVHSLENQSLPLAETP